MKKLNFILIILLLIKSSLNFAQPGTLDSSFGNNGKVLKPSGGAFYFDHSLVIQTNGKIIVVGTNMETITLVRYNTGGALDKNFGKNGTVTADSGSGNTGNAVALQADGKIIIAGTANHHMILERYKTNGSTDSSFGNNGKVTNNLFDNGNALAIQSDGKIIVAGDANNSVGNKSGFISVARYNTNGSPDLTFDKDGTVSTDITDPPEYFGSGYATSLAIQSDGKILLAGYNYDEFPQGGFVVVRYLSNGKPDNRFGTNGQMHKYNYPNDDRCYSIAVLPDNKILLAGYSYGQQQGTGFDFVLLKLKVNGSFDSSFGTNGIVLTDFDNNQDFGHKVLVQPDGKIIVAGYADASIVTEFILARYKPNGKPDKSFGDHGKVISYLNRPAQAFSAALQTDGKIILAGLAAGGVFALARYKGDGSLEDAIINTSVVSKDKKQYFIYPNPFQSTLNIEFNKDIILNKTINIYDVNGRLLLTKAAPGNAQIDVKQLTAGTYVIKINDENGKLLYNGKVVKQ